VNGELGQLIAIASHGSTWLAGPPDAPPPALESSSWTFRYVGSLRFTLEGASGAEDVRSLEGWLVGLRGRGVERLWLTTADAGPVRVGRTPVEERYLVAFAGAGSWSLLATGSSNEVWRASWTVGDQGAPDQRIWVVEYRGMALEERVEPPRPSTVEKGLRLREALHAVREFAASQDLDEWADVFVGAAEAGAEADDLLAGGAAPEAHALAAAAARAWVFGGMGSWNDLSFQGEAQQRYEQVSEELYRAVLGALVAATNV
jgi:hypothetical protein